METFRNESFFFFEANKSWKNMCDTSILSLGLNMQNSTGENFYLCFLFALCFFPAVL